MAESNFSLAIGGAQAFGGAVSDLFAGFGTGYKAKGDLLEAGSYDAAAQLALQNEEFAKESTAIKETQAQRELFKAQGTTAADIGGAGFSLSGSGLDLLRSNAQQGALTQAVVERQGAITEAGYAEQATAYQNMAAAARAGAAAESSGGIGDFIGAGLNAVAGAASIGELMHGG